ncbi:class I glutamine amidotransferase-like protein [Delitschia confertaspora ATCC 74209]|uniref:Class I glutamine amidotransferase-like protein n=1 Tax=Delitschia confertaspora ATCC 74209 TaxID=1513339 RepID=A0A9P4JDJ3_9PLEO|nr:class I glutamine amidotransferase-like protein [Delitschia confertaspora ATCC 74209]
MAPNSPVHIGVLIVPPVQLLDISPVDLFAMMTKSYLSACKLPDPLIAQGLDLKITWISFSGPNTLGKLTADASIAINAGLDDPSVAPGKLDVLVIPGPDPGFIPKEEELGFVRAHLAKGADVLTICSGVFVAGYAGILDGKRATAPRSLLGPGAPKGMNLREKFADVKWEEKRWSNDGTIWTAGGITNGQDMAAAYIRQRWPGVAAETVLRMADVGERAQEYSTGSTVNNAWWVMNIARAWVGGLVR